MKNLIVYFITLLLLTSCGASFHFNKFLEKGGKIENKIDSVQVITKVNGKDSLIYVRVECPDVETPKTKVEIRQDAKTERKAIKLEALRLKNEIKEENKTLRVKIRHQSKISKQDNKTERVKYRQEGKTERKKHSIWWVLFYLLGLITIPIFKAVKKLIL